jgi:hypothetical protein
MDETCSRTLNDSDMDETASGYIVKQLMTLIWMKRLVDTLLNN